MHGVQCRPKRFQFSMRVLLVAVVVVATALMTWKYAQYKTTQREFLGATVLYEMGVVKAVEVCEASKNLLDAELALPFVSRRRIWVGHTCRLWELEQELELKAISPFREPWDGLDEDLAAVREYRIHAEQMCQTER